MLAVASAAALSLALAGLSDAGVEFRVYSNTALAGTPTRTSVLPTATFRLPPQLNGQGFSAELVGTVDVGHTAQTGGSWWNVTCDFEGTTLGFVWIDGHLVCHDGHAYTTEGPGNMDNPLPINVFNLSRGPVASLPFRAHIYRTPAVTDRTVECGSLASKGCYNDSNHNQCGFNSVGSAASNTWRVAAELCYANGYPVAGAEGSGAEVWCGGTLTPSCPRLPDAACNKPCPGNASQTCGAGWTLEVLGFECRTEPSPPPLHVGLTVSVAKSVSASGPFGVPKVLAGLEPKLPPLEVKRDAMQHALAVGWAPSLHSNMLAIVKQPEAATLTTQLCSVVTGACLVSATPDGGHRNDPCGAGVAAAKASMHSRSGKKTKPMSKDWHDHAPGCEHDSGTAVRVGHHAWDRSYVQFYFGPGPGVNANVSVEYTVSGPDRSSLDVLVSCASSHGCGGYELRVVPRFAFFRGGNTSVSRTPTTAPPTPNEHSTPSATNERSVASATDGLTILFEPTGLSSTAIYATPSQGGMHTDSSSNASANDSSRAAPLTAMVLPLNTGTVGFSTTPNTTTAAIGMKLVAARKAEEDLLRATFTPLHAESGQAIKAAAMWTLVSTPEENALAPFNPVSRAWGHAVKSLLDFSYCIYDWDNFFASIIAATGAPASSLGFGFAVSNLIQTVKAKTAAGFIANNDGGAAKSEIRSEPPVGSKVTLELAKKFGAGFRWVVELLYDDLLDWSDWYIRSRQVHGNLIALGGGNMQCGRYESGQDDSPMYDGRGSNIKSPRNPLGDLGGDFYNASVGLGGLMEMADVGQTSLAAQEAYALAELGAMIKKPATLIQALKQRGDALSAAISTHLWDEKSQVFANKFTTNNSFYTRVTPTAFYPLAARAATEEQAGVMMSRWMANTSHFCVTGSSTPNPIACHYGLPSVQRSDPAFPLGYWRGNVWGPHAQLTYWSLDQYSSVPSVAATKRALTRQMDSLMRSQWDLNRHICENYSPSLGAPLSQGDCTGTHFYHWGALTGVIGMMEDGYW